MMLLVTICLILALVRAYQQHQVPPMEPSEDMDPFIRSEPAPTHVMVSTGRQAGKTTRLHLVRKDCPHCQFKSARKPQP